MLRLKSLSELSLQLAGTVFSLQCANARHDGITGWGSGVPSGSERIRATRCLARHQRLSIRPTRYFLGKVASVKKYDLTTPKRIAANT